MRQKRSSSWDTSNLAPPNADEIEISLFGPSYGESLLIQPGQGRWLVVDSCLFPGTHEPMPLEYLRRIGVSPQKIERVIATHWDNDHIGGLAKILRSASAAKFVLSAAVFTEELCTLFRAYRDPTFGLEHGVDEINEVFDILLSRNQKPLLAKENTILWTNNADQNETASLVALSRPMHSSLMVICMPEH